MGYIANLTGKSFRDGELIRSPTNRGQGRRIWEQVFGNVSPAPESEGWGMKPVPGGSWNRSAPSSYASQARLIQALRSRAPGGWSDDRWAQTTTGFRGAVYVAIDRKCRQLAQAEFQVYRKDPFSPDGKRPVGIEEPPDRGRHVSPYKLVELLAKPNTRDSFGTLLWRWQQQLDLTGVALTWMIPNQLHVPMELYCIPTAIAIPQPSINPDFPEGFWRIQPVYPYGPFSSFPTPNSSIGAPIDARWMLQFQYPHPLLFYDGFSPLTGLNLEIDELNMINRSRHYKMRRGSNPDIVLNMDGMEGAQPLSEEEIARIHAEWENEFQGPENAGKMIVGTPGSKLERLGSDSPKEMDYPQSWEQLLSFILGGGFGITKPAAGMIEDVNYAGLFATLKQLHLLTLKPVLDFIAGHLTRRLATFFGDDLIIEIRLPRIDDHEIKAQKLDKLISGRAITKNELRKELEMPLTKEEWGDEIAGEAEEQEQPGMPHPDAMPPAPGAAGPEQKPQTGQPTKPADEEREEPEEVAKARPKPAKLGEGALGPRMKHLNGEHWTKSLYEELRGAFRNGSY